MKHLFFKIILFLLALTLSNCESQTEEETWNPQLPPITQTGANTFGCKINGKIMIPRDSRVSQLGGIPTGVSYGWSTSSENYDWIKALDRYTSRGGVAFKLPEIQNLGVGEYLIQNIEAGFATTYPNIVYMQVKSHIDVDLFGSIEGTGKIIITRYDDEVISGTFYCKLKGYNNPNHIIEVTEGRFDFKKSTINTHRFR